MTAESIETARLTLRRPRATDADGIFQRYASDPRVTRFMAWPTHRSVDDTRAFLAFADQQWEQWATGAYQIVRRADQVLLGGTGLEFESPTRAETGYVLAHDAWGQGYATEALAAMIELGGRLGAAVLTAGCHPDHHRSIRVLEKGGFVQVERRPRKAGFPNLEPGLSQDLLVYQRAL